MKVKTTTGWPYGPCYSKPTGIHGQPQVRSEGLHLGTIIHATAVRLGILSKDLPDGFELMGHLGCAWEDYLAAYLPGEHLYHPPEWEVDGIFMSPDDIQITNDGDPIVHEFKVRWWKPGGAIEKRQRELWQLMAYCRAVETDIGVLHILHAAGNYQPPFPVYARHEITFSEQELTDNWRMILRERDAYLKEQSCLNLK